MKMLCGSRLTIWMNVAGYVVYFHSHFVFDATLLSMRQRTRRRGARKCKIIVCIDYKLGSIFVFHAVSQCWRHEKKHSLLGLCEEQHYQGRNREGGEHNREAHNREAHSHRGDKSPNVDQERYHEGGEHNRAVQNREAHSCRVGQPPIVDQVHDFLGDRCP
jgi:hypothetical protein